MWKIANGCQKLAKRWTGISRLYCICSNHIMGQFFLNWLYRRSNFNLLSVR